MRSMTRILVAVPLVVVILLLFAPPNLCGEGRDRDRAGNPGNAAFDVHEYGLAVFLARGDASYPECVALRPGFVFGRMGDTSALASGVGRSWDTVTAIDEGGVDLPDETAGGSDAGTGASGRDEPIPTADEPKPAPATPVRG